MSTSTRARRIPQRRPVRRRVLQHEFGIFGGEAGAHILELLSRLTMPVVTDAAHGVGQAHCGPSAVVERIVEASSKVVVMAHKGRELAAQRLSAPDDKIEVIPHGIPDVAFCRIGRSQDQARICRPIGHSDLRPAVSQTRASKS